MNSTYVVFVISIVTIGVNFLLILISGDIQKKDRNSFCTYVMTTLQMFGAHILFLGLIAYYIVLIKDITDINSEQLSFYVNNNCSDVTLNYAFSQILKDYKQLMAMAISGCVITLLGFIVQVVVTLISFGVIGEAHVEGGIKQGEGQDSYGTFN